MNVSRALAEIEAYRTVNSFDPVVAPELDSFIGMSTVVQKQTFCTDILSVFLDEHFGTVDCSSSVKPYTRKPRVGSSFHAVDCKHTKRFGRKTDLFGSIPDDARSFSFPACPCSLDYVAGHVEGVKGQAIEMLVAGCRVIEGIRSGTGFSESDVDTVHAFRDRPYRLVLNSSDDLETSNIDAFIVRVTDAIRSWMRETDAPAPYVLRSKLKGQFFLMGLNRDNEHTETQVQAINRMEELLGRELPESLSDAFTRCFRPWERKRNSEFIQQTIGSLPTSLRWGFSSGYSVAWNKEMLNVPSWMDGVRII